MLIRFLIVPLALLPLAFGYGNLLRLSDDLIQELLNRYGNNIKDDPYKTDNEKQSTIGLSGEDEPLIHKIPDDAEYLEHSSLFGHQDVQGGAGEGRQLLKPDGSIENLQVIKSDSILPSYCDPPNPCPLGYTAEGGCLEDFTNSATFSRDYQSSQKCMCDREHMFDCLGNTEENQLDAIARSIQNDALSDQGLDKLVEGIQNDHKVVAKKFHASKKRNPPTCLMGEKLPVVAKKAPYLSGN